MEHNDVQWARKTGLWWAKCVHLVRCGACPMHCIALRTTPARMNEFDSIKWVNNYFLWYDASVIGLNDKCSVSSEVISPRAARPASVILNGAHSVRSEDSSLR